MRFSEEVNRGLYYTKNEDFEEYVFVEKLAFGYEEPLVIYFKVLNPEAGSFVCTLSEFLDERGYSRVVSLIHGEQNLKTSDLLKELINRKDSPIHDLDIEGAESIVFSKDYVCGFPMTSPEGVSYLPQVVPFDTQEEAEKYSHSHVNGSFNRPKVYKRILIEVE